MILVLFWISSLLTSNASSLSTLPIFPLRKQVLLPGETLTLNLYEERYLKLSESVLSAKNRQFGAVYGTHKPQMVRRGTGAVVPMLQPGDVGVLCQVMNVEDALVPTRGGSRRRRIRFEATAVGVFNIERIIDSGFEAGSYIVAEVNDGAIDFEMESFTLAALQLAEDASQDRLKLLQECNVQERMKMLMEMAS